MLSGQAVSEFMEHSSNKSVLVRTALILLTLTAIIFTGMGSINASAAVQKIVTPTLTAEARYDSSATHPYNKQTSQLNVRWNKCSGANSYDLYVKGGKWSNWARYKTTSSTSVTVTGLKRTTSYQFKVKANYGKLSSGFSSVQTLKTARMDYDADGWQAMCRIVYHEVGQINSSVWDRPIVYVADAVANRYVGAKYANVSPWVSYYRNYKTVQSMIYNSGGFMSSAGLTRDGATYARVPAKVKTAVYGAVYGVTAYNGIANNYKVYYWCNRSYNSTSSKVAYSFKIPWGYFLIYKTYWG